MQGFGGKSSTFGTTTVRSVILDDETDDVDPPDDDSGDPLYFMTLRYRIRYDETVPTF
jgi:hypothetical protein